MATKNKHTKKQSNFSLIITALLSIVLVAIIVFGVFVLINDPKVGDKDKKDEAETTDVKKELKNNTDEQPKIDEKQEPTDTETTYDDSKTGYESGNENKPVEHNTDGKKVATASLTVAKADTFIILSGRVTNFKEEGGSCTYKLKRDSLEKSYTKPVIPDAKNTVCEAVKLDKNELGSGQWTVWIEYKSNSAEGKSETQTINL